MKDGTLVTSQDLVGLLGVSSATINYYTNLGLFRISDRKGNQRLYEKNEIKELHDRIRKLRKEGYTLRIIQDRLQKGYQL